MEPSAPVNDIAAAIGIPISVLFVLAMLLLVIALLCLLLEVSNSTRKILQGVAELMVVKWGAVAQSLTTEPRLQ